MSSFEEQIGGLRNQIDDLDTQLVELFAKRLQVTQKVGELKSQFGKPIFDAEREASLIRSRREQAIQAGVPADMIEDVLRRLIRDSYVSQDASGYRCVNPHCRKVVVIGGLGQLGKVFVDLFSRSGYQVAIIEQDDWPNSDEIFDQASLVIVSVPIRLTNYIISQLNDLPSDCILADVTSIKVSPLAEMLKAHSGPVVGLHPMFGPDVSGLVKQNIIACQGRDPEQCQWLIEQFEVWGANIYHVDAPAHDQAMSMVQVMRHFSTIAYGYHLMAEGADISQLVEMSSPIYRLELIMVGRLFAQNPVLYTDIIFSNPDNIAMMKRFAHRFLALLEDVEMAEKDSFITRFKEVKAWFGDYADTFLKESKSILSKADELKKN